MTDNQIVINNLSKVYDNGFNALKNINLSIKKGEIFAMLGPNWAGKTTLISIICGIVNPTSGEVKVDNFDIFDVINIIKAKAAPIANGFPVAKITYTKNPVPRNSAK